jgi:hypothetical protein
MSFTLYDALIPTYQQILGAVDGLLSKAEAYCAENNIEPGQIIQARLYEDMLPFSYQVSSTATHSLGAIEGVRQGVFSPDLTPPPDTFAALRAKVAHAREAVGALTPAEVNAFQGRDMRFEIRDIKLPFTAEDFLMSFSLPNFYFHAATAYDILRHRGVSLGKRDFLGRMRLKT